MNETQINFEFEEYPDLKIDSNQLLFNTKKTESSKSVNGFDPYQTMIQKKKVESNEIEKWPKKDIESLEIFCKNHNIVGFNTGKMPPSVALAFLKKHLGIITDSPTESLRYTDVVRKKILLNG